MTGTICGMTAPTAPVEYYNSVRIGYARVSSRSQEHQMQVEALGAAHCREIVVETASTRGERPKLYATLDRLHAGDTLVIYKPDRVARSMKELLVLLEDQLHARGINLHILTRDLRRHPPPERGHHRRQDAVHSRRHGSRDGTRPDPRTHPRRGARRAGPRTPRWSPTAVDEDVLAVVRARQARHESVTAIAKHLGVGRSTL